MVAGSIFVSTLATHLLAFFTVSSFEFCHCLTCLQMLQKTNDTTIKAVGKMKYLTNDTTITR